MFLERSNTKKIKWCASEGVCRIETAGRFMKNRMNCHGKPGLKMQG
jgi:hypothetical protein